MGCALMSGGFLQPGPRDPTTGLMFSPSQQLSLQYGPLCLSSACWHSHAAMAFFWLPVQREAVPLGALQATGHPDPRARMGQGFSCILGLALTTVVLPFAAVLMLRSSRVRERQGRAASLCICQQVEIHGAGMGGGEGGI